uniref:alpha amylase family protein n=1 Tax=uncultured Draconibacterium sp. TaxID=1573823 RepID=UPI0032179D7B
MKQVQSIISWSIAVWMLLTLAGCGGKDPVTPEWEWDDDISNEKKPRFIWIDAAANFPDFANSKENILRDLKLAKEAGFTGVVVDVRPTTGDVLFETTVENQVSWLGAWLPAGYTKIERTSTWDYLQAFIDAGHSLDLKVYAGVNTFSGGNTTSIGSEGMLFRNPERKEWATSLLTQSGIVNTLDRSANGAKFFNPVREDVQNYLCDMLADLASYEGLDGIILDRGRFNGMNSDFSDYTKEKFENFLGSSVPNFPTDVMIPGTTEGKLPNPQPTYMKKWLEFRVKVIHDFMEKAKNTVKDINPEIQFGVYVGGWYSSYYGVGVNWASPTFNAASTYSQWATSEYKNYGYADLMDIIIIGAYAAPTRIYGSTEWTVQGFCSQAANKIKDDALVIGGPDVGNGDWASSSDAVTGQAIIQSVDAAMSACDGYFLFDMIHLKKKNQWHYAQKGIEAATSK